MVTIGGNDIGWVVKKYRHKLNWLKRLSAERNFFCEINSFKNKIIKVLSSHDDTISVGFIILLFFKAVHIPPNCGLLNFDSGRSIHWKEGDRPFFFMITYALHHRSYSCRFPNHLTMMLLNDGIGGLKVCLWIRCDGNLTFRKSTKTKASSR